MSRLRPSPSQESTGTRGQIRQQAAWLPRALPSVSFAYRLALRNILEALQGLKNCNSDLTPLEVLSHPLIFGP
ncbi:hypothetical protein RRG08_027227 [Elysia crispata]|uniref:Uncharacterized protein n=1 Tax=Elysia crispata TaxID=231223 RepID=A0AAE1DLT9_9GAST|nr:hypothetical protein RRG08_027227 [Elysia crispata]